MQTLTEPTLENITLYYREGTSDKVYQCAIEPAGERFVVNFAYGRRGSTLNTGTKTNVPVEYDNAKRIFDKLVKEKTAKGYTQGEDGTPYQTPDTTERFTGILPQLLNPIDEAEALRLLNDTAFVMQQKFNGRRMLIRKQDAVIHGINKKGLLIGLPETVFHDIHQLPGNFILDGECIGDVFHAFDLLMVNNEDLRPYPYRERLTALMNLLASAQHRFISSCSAKNRKGSCSSVWMHPTPRTVRTAAGHSSSTSSTPRCPVWWPKSTCSGVWKCGCWARTGGCRVAMSPSQPITPSRRWAR
jgi:bifunctional non-homologous end joining protein LigD